MSIVYCTLKHIPPPIIADGRGFLQHYVSGIICHQGTEYNFVCLTPIGYGRYKDVKKN